MAGKKDVVVVEGGKKNGTFVAKCAKGCQHDFQDKLYGKGIRLFNGTKSGGGRCTVCSNVQGK